VSRNVHARPIALADIDLKWLVGQVMIEYAFSEPDLWTVSFSGGGQLATQSSWRVLAAARMVVSSADHGHRFGGPEPTDAAALASQATSASAVVAARVGASAPDLELRLENGVVLQVLALSSGYECWQLTDPSGVAIVVNGSRDAATWTDTVRS
jgi:hypothetical protein